MTVRDLTAYQTERLEAFAKFNRRMFDTDPVFNPDTGEWQGPLSPYSLYPVQPLHGLEFDGIRDRGLVVAGRLPESVTCITEVVAGEFQAFKPGPSMLTSALEFLSLDLNDPESPMYRLLPGPQMRGRPCISRYGARALLYYQTVPPGVDYLAFQIRAKCARVIVPRCTWKPRPWMLAEATRRRAAERAGTWAAVAATTLEDE